MFKKFRIALAILAGALGTGAVVAPAAQALPPLIYTNMGDSFAAGVGATGATGTCLVSPNSWSNLLVNQYSAFYTITNNQLACSGHAAEFMHDQAGADQVDSLTTSAGIVTLEAGGNDLGFSTIIGSCLPTGSNTTCLANIAAAQTRLNSTLLSPQTLPARTGMSDVLNDLYDAVDNKTASRIILVGYPLLWEDSDTTGCAAYSGWDSAEIAAFNALNHDLNDMIAAKATIRGYSFADLEPLSVGHDLCDGAASYYNQFTYHPNDAGNIAIKNAVAAVI